ncbi:hypothetical protein BB560_003937 [Smittium megazygosporum]|uniref:peptidyl-tRNA hydrolase n=1 Tax=Smittium megazygosporum TaxID=133381 RepID=A0A2T9ZAL0_9FUNG|nr:hypothetical protein BB560_003937 [Smittium megazygosporum]
MTQYNYNSFDLLTTLAIFTGAFVLGRYSSSYFKINSTSALKKTREAPRTKLRKQGELKMVLVVRSDLKMGKGKIAAQCSHATLACYKKSLREAPEKLQTWEYTAQAKVALKCQNEAQLISLYKKAKSQGIVAEYIRDAGRTQIEAGSITVLGIGPDYLEEVDKITGELQLL